ncbi:MAG: hypothetical protein HKN17_04150, partial [Rhodothermales bacterium]|nr:hypothetical protein [Rhodothermales bacterium]
MGRSTNFGPHICVLLALSALPVLPAAAQPEQSGELIARSVERAPLEIEDGIPTGLHGLVGGGVSAFLRSAGDENIGKIDYAFAAGLLYQFTPSVGLSLEQHIAAYPSAGLDYNASVLAVRLGVPGRRLTPTLGLGVRSAWGNDIDRFGGWIGVGLDWKINRTSAITPMFGTTPVDAGSGVAGLSMLGAGVRLQLAAGPQPALLGAVAYPDTLWRDEQATFAAALDSISSPADVIEWRFSDGRIARGHTVRHAFPRPGP